MESGIYQIRNLVNDKIYVGSTSATFNERWRDHKKGLRGGYHDNSYLQNAFNKYGEDNFKFEVIERCKNVTEREQWYLDNWKPWNPDVGYNLSRLATNNNNRSKIWKGFINPKTNKEEEIYNLKDFCRINGLKYYSMLYVYECKQRSHKGWTTKESKKLLPPGKCNAKMYYFISPEGKETEIHNLNDFCRENNLTQSGMWKVYNGKQKSHRGWTKNLNPQL